MPDNRISAFIQTNLSRGYTPEKIKEVLVNHGWREELINGAFPQVTTSTEVKTVSTKSHFSLLLTLWVWPIIWGIIFFEMVLGYEWLKNSGVNFLSVTNAFAGAGAICIGISFLLAPLSYYISFFDRLIASRKGFGIVGFFFALFHSISLLFVFPDKYFYGFLDNIFTLDVILGIISMSIFGLMTIVSNGTAMRLIGISKWKFILRLGFIAYFLLIIRAFVIQGDQFVEWITALDGLPPTRLIAILFASFVLFMRFLMQISLIINKQGK